MSLGNPSGPSDPNALMHGSPVLDAAAMKALSHPLRLKMLKYLNDHLEATSSTLAKYLGESTGQTSYHLRQLAKYGIIEEIEGRGTGRERWWKPKSFTVDQTEDFSPTAMALGNNSIQENAADAQRFLETLHLEPEAWRGLSALTRTTTALTLEQMQTLNEELAALTAKYTKLGKKNHETQAEGTRRIRFTSGLFPLPED